MNVSVYKSFTDTSPVTYPLAKIIDAVMGSAKLKMQVERIRQAVEAGNDALVEALKKALPHFTASATFNGPRRLDYLMGYNGVVQADVDEVDVESIALIRRHAKTDPYVAAGYTSPTGKGFKLFVKTASESRTTHAVAFRTVASYIKATYQVTIDKVCKDLNRCCFMGYDPDAFYKEAAPLPLIDGLSDVSDTGRAQKFLDRFYPVLRFVPPWKRWLVFMGGNWHDGTDGAVRRLVDNVWIPELKAELEAWLSKKMGGGHGPAERGTEWIPGDIEGISNAGDANEDILHGGEADDAEERKRQLKKLKKAVEMMLSKYTNNDPLKRMFEAASTSSDVIIPPAMVDGEPMLVGVSNGFINLETGEFSAHNAEVVITKKMNAAYNSTSTCPRWDQFVRDVLPNSKVRTFVAKAMGLCLTGRLNKGIMFLWGTGDNGKSVFLDVMFAVFGEYAVRTSPKLLYSSKYMDDVPEHQKAELFGKRLAIGSEIAQDAKLNEAAVKEVTGESTTMACRKYEHPFTFQQTAKIWIAGNHSPVVKGTDNAIWGRINKVEFPSTFDKTQNTDIRDRLIEEAPGILNWLLRAARHGIEHGNKPPKEVVLAVDEYRREEDMLREFIDEYFLEGEFIEVVLVYEAYQKWAKEAGVEHPLTRRRLVKELKNRGFVYDRDKTGNKRGFRGKQINPAAYHPEEAAF